jgi:hypothetical protein
MKLCPVLCPHQAQPSATGAVGISTSSANLSPFAVNHHSFHEGFLVGLGQTEAARTCIRFTSATRAKLRTPAQPQVIQVAQSGEIVLRR